MTQDDEPEVVQLPGPHPCPALPPISDEERECNPGQACAECGAPAVVVRVTETTEAGTAEAMVSGQRSFDDVRELVRKALQDRGRAADPDGYSYVSISDLTATEVVYGNGYDSTGLLAQCSYSVAANGTVTLGAPAPVVRTYAPAPPGSALESSSVDGLTEARVAQPGRVLEAKGKAADGGRIFRSQIIAYGDSANGRRYPESVMRSASGLYEGALAYDRHRQTAEVTSGSTVGLIGFYRNVEATAEGLEADLHLLPSATHAAEALDAALAMAAEGIDVPLGVSHDVMATFKPITSGGRRLQEATAIVRVMSADVVAHPAAGGRPVRVVAGGIDTDSPADSGGAAPTQETDVTLAELLALLKDASPEQRKQLQESFAAAETTTETTAPEGTPATPVVEPVAETTEPAPNALPRGSWLAGAMIRDKVKAATLPDAVVESITAGLPDRVTESDVDTAVGAYKAALAGFERAGLTPSTATAVVTKEARDKKVEALDAMFAGDYGKGYRSFRHAFEDVTGRRPRSFDEDYNRTILRESMGVRMYDSAAARAEESMTSGTWDQILGDSITRRMVAEYARPSLATWRAIVSSIVPVTDFRTQRIDRLGGYGVLPSVNEGAPYQPLTSPTDEEASYRVTKRGGTEDLTLEMIANDDLRQIVKIPTKLGLAAAQTLFRFVWDILPANAVTTYDSTALFAAGHNNTTAATPLNQAGLSTLRRKMRQQTSYGDSYDILSIIPKFLVVPSALEEIAYQLSTSAVAIPVTPAGPSDTPNIHAGLRPIVVDYYTDQDDWYLIADPTLVPTIEVGFYNGREEPELFTQSDPTVGSMFDADKLTWKIRHIYSGVVLDHRGFQRGAN